MKKDFEDEVDSKYIRRDRKSRKNQPMHGKGLMASYANVVLKRNKK